MSFNNTTSGSNQFMLVGIINASVSDLVTGVTYNGVAMTQLHKRLQVIFTGYQYIYGLAAPATGTNDIVINSSLSNTVKINAVVYTGVKQTGQPDSTGGNNVTSTSFSITNTTVADNSWLYACTRDDQGSTVPTPDGSTNRLDDFAASTTNHAWDSVAAETPAGSQSLAWTQGTNTNWDGLMVSIAPAVAAPATAPSQQRGPTGGVAHGGGSLIF